MSDDEHKMPGGAEGGLPAKLAPKEQPKKLPVANSASQEESSEIQQRVNTLSQALKQSMAVSTETESRRKIRALRVYSVAQNCEPGVKREPRRICRQCDGIGGKLFVD